MPDAYDREYEALENELVELEQARYELPPEQFDKAHKAIQAEMRELRREAAERAGWEDEGYDRGWL